MEPTPLYDYVLACLRSRAIPQRKVAAESGVPFSTVTKIAQGAVKEPSVHTVQRLADYFRRALPPTPEPPPAPSRPHPLPASGQGVNTASPTAAAVQTVEAGQGDAGETAYEASTFISSNEAA